MRYVQTINPEGEYVIQKQFLKGISISYFQKQSQEGNSVGKQNEDVIGWKIYNSDLFSFIVCDGVSQSYFGSIAARFLAEKILNYFQYLIRNPSAITSETIQSELNSWATQAHRIVLSTTFTYETAPGLLDVIKERQSRGSQTVFFAGCIDLRPGSDQLSFFTWMGNVFGQVFDKYGNPLLNSDEMGDDSFRWSTVDGCHGSPSCRLIPSSEIKKIIVFSDGLLEFRDNLLNPTSSKYENQLIEKLQKISFTDDGSYLCLAISRDKALRETKNSKLLYKFPYRYSSKFSILGFFQGKELLLIFVLMILVILLMILYLFLSQRSAVHSQILKTTLFPFLSAYFWQAVVV